MAYIIRYCDGIFAGTFIHQVWVYEFEVINKEEAMKENEENEKIN